MRDSASLAALWWDVWRDGNLELLDEIVADPFVRHTAHENAVRTRAQAKEDMARYRTSHELATIRIDAQRVTDDEVWQRVTTTGVNLTTEELLTMTWIQVFRIETGRLAEMWLLYAVGMDWSNP